MGGANIYQNMNTALRSILNKSWMAVVGFEPTPPRRLVPKTSALDHSATLPRGQVPDVTLYEGNRRLK